MTDEASSNYCNNVFFCFRDKKNRRDKKGQNNAQAGTQNGCTSPGHDSNEADPIPVIETSNIQSVRTVITVDIYVA